jgi:HEPN domain-containing protein
MLIEKKNSVEYEGRRASASEATQAVERAERIVTWARDVVTEGRV